MSSDDENPAGGAASTTDTPTASARKLSVLNDAVHERRPSEVVERRPSHLSGERRPSHAAPNDRRPSQAPHAPDLPELSPQESSDSLAKSPKPSTSQSDAKTDDGGEEEMAAIPEEPADASGTPPPHLAAAASDALLRMSDPLRSSQMSTAAKPSSSLRDGVLSSIRGFRKAVNNVFSSGAGEDTAGGPDSPRGGPRSIAFTPIAPVLPPMSSSAAAGDDEARVGQSEMYGAFFRMLRMGVPPGAVKSKMTSKGLNGAVLDLGEDGLMSKAHLLEVQLEQELKKKLAGATKGERLHWDPVPAERLVNKDTVWGSGASEFRLPDEVLQQAKAVFVTGKPQAGEGGAGGREKQALQPVAETKKRAAKLNVRGAQAPARTALDPRRAQGINIMVKKLKVTPAILCKALEELDEKVLTPGAVEVLVATGVWPAGDDEAKSLQALLDAGVELTGADSLVWLVHHLVPDAEARLRAMAFRYEFDTLLVDTEKGILVAKQAAKELMASERVKRILQIVLDLGNCVNAAVSAEPVKAITLASLGKLAMTKSVDDKAVTMLDFLVEILGKQTPDSLRVLEDLPSLAAARRVELQAHMRLIRDTRRAVEGLRKVKQLEFFAFSAMQKLDTVESHMGVARDFFDRTCVYFAIEVGAMDSHELYETLFVFLDSMVTLAEKSRKAAELVAKKLEQEKQQKQGRSTTAQQRQQAPAASAPGGAEGADAGPRKARRSVFERVTGALQGGPPRPPVPVFTKKPIS